MSASDPKGRFVAGFTPRGAHAFSTRNEGLGGAVARSCGRASLFTPFFRVGPESLQAFRASGANFDVIEQQKYLARTLLLLERPWLIKMTSHRKNGPRC